MLAVAAVSGQRRQAGPARNGRIQHGGEPPLALLAPGQRGIRRQARHDATGTARRVAYLSPTIVTRQL
nr:hypothetical protein GCM10020092_031660 [Actinoplanes digitatis]